MSSSCLISSASLAASSLREAHEHIQAAYHLAPENGDVLLVMGEVFARQGKLDKALQSFDRALKRSEAPLPIHVARSRLLLQIGRGEQAVATLKAAVADDPESVAGWAALSQIEDAAGNLSEAVDAAGRAVQIAPRQTSHRLQLGGELDLAIEALGPQALGQVRVQHLDSDFPVVLEVGGEIDRGHAAAPQLALDPVSTTESGLQAGESVGHGLVSRERELIGAKV
jgi:predicted Zn-dependent protease